jgi:hypothetical protein
MAEEFTEAELQDIAKALSNYRHAQVDDLIRRFGLEEIAGQANASNIYSRIYSLLRNADQKTQIKLINRILEEQEPLRTETINDLEDALADSSFVLSKEDFQTKIKQEVSTGILESEPEKKREIDLEGDLEDNELEVLREKTLNDILHIMDDFAYGISNSSPPIRDLDEEALRDLFLSDLNTHYKGIATGETFNKNGKTDIFLRYDNEPLFVAEVKFWDGKVKYQEAIEQLLRYLTNKDTDAALLIFSRNQKYPDVKEKTREATINHPQCGDSIEGYTEHEVYQFIQNTDVPVNIAIKTFDLG